MTDYDDPRRAAERVRTALELFDLAVGMLRARHRREHPDATDEEVDQRVVEWLRERPGAEQGDAAGRPGSWPRVPR